MKHISHIIPAHPVFYTMTEFWVEKFPEFSVVVYLMKSKEDKQDYHFPNNNITIVEYSCSSELVTHTLNILRESSIVFLHCSFFPLIAKIKLLIKGVNKFFEKIVWIEWGCDLYYWDNTSLIGCAKSYVKSVIIKLFEKKISFFVAIHPVDIKAYNQKIKGNAYTFCAPYDDKRGMSKSIEQSVKTSIKEKLTNKKPIVIQVGHRADHILKHKETLDLLKKFSSKNIMLYIPLCYGDKKYANEIVNYAKERFGNKVFCQTEIVPYEEYIECLRNVDIFILNSRRQIALGNLEPMMVMQKKIVMPNQSVLYDFYSEFAPIFQYENLKNCSFDEFIEDVDMSAAKHFVLKMANIDPVESWNNVFNKIIDIRRKV